MYTIVDRYDNERETWSKSMVSEVKHIHENLVYTIKVSVITLVGMDNLHARLNFKFLI